MSFSHFTVYTKEILKGYGNGNGYVEVISLFVSFYSFLLLSTGDSLSSASSYPFVNVIANIHHTLWRVFSLGNNEFLIFLIKTLTIPIHQPDIGEVKNLLLLF